MAHDGVFRALADPTRRRILRLLADGDQAAGDLAAEFAMTAPSVSHHFNVLKAAELITVRRVGQQLIYSLNTTVFQEVLSSLMEVLPPEKS